MTQALLLGLLALSGVLLNYSHILHGPPHLQIFNIKSQIQVTHELLARDCAAYINEKREDDLTDVDLEVLNIYYRKLLSMLVECRNKRKHCILMYSAIVYVCCIAMHIILQIMMLIYQLIK